MSQIVCRDWILALPDSFTLLTEEEKIQLPDEFATVNTAVLKQMEWAQMWETLSGMKSICPSIQYKAGLHATVCVAVGKETDVPLDWHESVCTAVKVLQEVGTSPATETESSVGPWTEVPLSVGPKLAQGLAGSMELDHINK